jgi:hypothetical protein
MGMSRFAAVTMRPCRQFIPKCGCGLALCQAVYRRHDRRVVFIGFLSDAATAVTVDGQGLVALWPAGDGGRSGK